MIQQKIALSALALTVLLLIGACATLPEDFEQPASYALHHTQDTALGRAHADDRAVHPGASGFLLLGNGLDAFVARAMLAQSAERSLDVQYYLYHDDLVGRLFTDQLLKAADRGVRVRILVDDMDLSGRDLGVWVMDSHPNVEVRIFNPFSRYSGRTSQFVTRLGSVTRRMHNKTFTADNQAAILGGRNIGNEYFNADPDLAFEDLDVLAIGPVVPKVSRAFDRYWNSDLAYPAAVLIRKPPTPEQARQKRELFDAFIAQQRDSEYLRALKNSDLAHRLRKNQIRFSWGDAVAVYDSPEKIDHAFNETQYHLAPKLRPYFESVDRELIIFSPYFVPGTQGTAFLAQLSQRGVRVRILTNSLSSNDVGIVHAGYAKYRKQLLRAGIELYELNKQLTREVRKTNKGKGGASKASLHAKSFVFDRQRLFVGSLNLDPRALVHNTEIGLVIEQAEMAAEMGDWFDANIDAIAFKVTLVTDKDGTEQLFWHGLVNGEPEILEKEPYTGYWQRFWNGFLSFWPLESQL
jgi:putative cardiolipin synthase